MELAGYELLELLGGGAATAVYRARQCGRAGRVVAVKRLCGGDPVAHARLRREGEVLARLRHPNIVRLLEVIPDGEGVALVLTYAAGGCLAARLAEAGPLPVPDVAAVAGGLADALTAVHAAGLVHRDLSPANVLLHASGAPLLADFGAAGAPAPHPAEPVGTAEYLDPAVVAGSAPDQRADVYALAVVCYEALAGTPPYAGSSPLATLRAADRGLHLPLAELRPDAPTALVKVIERGLDRDPDRRYPCAAAFAAALRSALPDRAGRPIPAGLLDPVIPAGARALPPAGRESGGTRVFGPRPPRPAAPPQPPRVRPAVVALLAVLLLGAPPAGLWLWQQATAARGSPPVASLAGLPAPARARGDAAAVRVPSGRACRTSPRLPLAVRAVAADLDGDGCPILLAWAGNVLHVPVNGRGWRRYLLGAAGDVALAGDWTATAATPLRCTGPPPARCSSSTASRGLASSYRAGPRLRLDGPGARRRSSIATGTAATR